jgi:hypothetical protein
MKESNTCPVCRKEVPAESRADDLESRMFKVQVSCLFLIAFSGMNPFSLSVAFFCLSTCRTHPFVVLLSVIYAFTFTVFGMERVVLYCTLGEGLLDTVTCVQIAIDSILRAAVLTTMVHLFSLVSERARGLTP